MGSSIPIVRCTLAWMALSLGLAGCDRPPGTEDLLDPSPAETPAVNQVQPPAYEIAWHEGSIDEAFAQARAESKPLFLYWGAEWCPHCQQIKATIFARREFIDLSRFFVPVYLDGDSEQAQRSGERFGVLGYPTMIVFDATGAEFTRIPSGIDIERYANVLQLALRAGRPVAELVRAALDGEALAEDDYRLLAYYSWAQDNDRALGGLDRVAAARALAEGCPSTLDPECARLYGQYLEAAIDAAGAERLDPALAAQARAFLNELLTSRARVDANLSFLLHADRQVLSAVTAPGSAERAKLGQRWSDVLGIIADDVDVSTSERLYAERARVRLHKLIAPDARLAPGRLAQIEARVRWADLVTRNPYERQPVLNTITHLLNEAGLVDQAEALLEEEIGRSRTPYYFMVSLAELAQENGRHEEAIGWLERAHREAVGPATRFQWGVYHLTGLLQMRPDDTPQIERVATEVFEELGRGADPFHGRNRRYMERLAQEFRGWKDATAETDRAALVARIRDHLSAACAGLDARESRSDCSEFAAKI